MRSLRMKMVMIMVILILALMLTTGAFLMSGVGNFYVSQFYEQMEGTFTPEFIAQLQRLSAEDNAPAQMKELLMAQAGLGIDITGRNVYILDQTGSVLDSSNQRTTVVMTQNILSAMNGEVGQSSSVTNDYMDLAVPVESDGAQYIAYIRDNRATVDALTSELLIIILRALALGLVICVILSFLLSQILITPIRALTVGTKRVAAGDFANRVTVDSRDEIGDLTRNFNHMAKVLQDTISEAENERNKLSTLFLHMTDGVVAFNTAGSVIHYNPAATQMLAQNLSSQTTFDEIFSKEAELDTLLTLRRPQYIEAQKTVGERELELFMAPFSSDHAQGGVLVVIHDVTEQRRSEQLKREFVANVSHELRTPLTNIKSYAETIVDTGDELPPELRSNFMNVIISEADRMTRIVQDLLTLSKIDYGKMEMNISRFPFLKAVQNVYDAAKLNAEQNHHHTMTLTCEGDIPDVNGDRERIEQVITNIVSNAVKYTPDGGKIDMTVGTSAKPKIGNYHFTTLTPNLGIVRRHGKDIVLADIPGLIEGAADGAGLGHDFLRHVERTRLLLHVLDIAGSEGRDPVEDFDQINHELANYGELAERPQIVVCNKSDLPDSEENVVRLKAHLAELGLDYPVFVVSAATHQGFDALLDKTGDMLEALPPIVHFEEEVSYDDSVKPGTFEVVRDGAVFEVVGSSMQRLIDSVNFDDEESMSWFHRTLRKWGVIDALRKAGAQEGDTVRIIDMEFDFVE